jgi:hypothetical protein
MLSSHSLSLVRKRHLLLESAYSPYCRREVWWAVSKEICVDGLEGLESGRSEGDKACLAMTWWFAGGPATKSIIITCRFGHLQLLPSSSSHFSAASHYHRTVSWNTTRSTSADPAEDKPVTYRSLSRNSSLCIPSLALHIRTSTKGGDRRGHCACSAPHWTFS